MRVLNPSTTTISGAAASTPPSGASPSSCTGCATIPRSADRLHSYLYRDTVLYMNKPRRLTRRESRDATRARLIAAAEKIFIRFGFDASSVERIAEAAGFSRGAFYSNFQNKDELFIAVLNKRHLAISSALEEIVRGEQIGR